MVDASITGTRWGGAEYLDNFLFSGIYNGTNCGAPCDITIYEQPAGQVAAVGDTAQFEVETPYDTDAGYQWQLDAGSGYQNVTNGTKYQGATTSLLTVSNVTLSYNNYKYRCVITYNGCSVNSDYGLLTLTAGGEANSSKKIGINITPARNLHVKDVLRLEPRNSPPTNAKKGDLYFDGVLNKLRVYDGTRWRNCSE